MLLSAMRSPLAQVNLPRPNKAVNNTAAVPAAADRKLTQFLRYLDFQPAFQQSRVARHRVTAKPVDDGNAEVELERPDLAIVDDLRCFGQFNIADNGGERRVFEQHDELRHQSGNHIA